MYVHNPVYGHLVLSLSLLIVTVPELCLCFSSPCKMPTMMILYRQQLRTCYCCRRHRFHSLPVLIDSLSKNNNNPLEHSYHYKYQQVLFFHTTTTTTTFATKMMESRTRLRERHLLKRKGIDKNPIRLQCVKSSSISTTTTTNNTKNDTITVSDDSSYNKKTKKQHLDKTIVDNNNIVTTVTPDSVKNILDRIFSDAGFDIGDSDNNIISERLETKAGWCLREGIEHIISVDNTGRILPLVEQHGLPPFYCNTMRSKAKCEEPPPSTLSSEEMIVAPQNCFQNLCRIVVGQLISEKAAGSIWKRLLATTNYNLTPLTVLQLALPKSIVTTTNNHNTKNKKENQTKDITSNNDDININITINDDEIDYQSFQKPASLSRAKARCIVHIAKAFYEKQLTEEFLLQQGDDKYNDNGNNYNVDKDTKIRNALLQIKGIGPWTCDMFFMYLEKSNILPLGDVGVRKGIQKYLKDSITGSGKNGTICPVKDEKEIQNIFKLYQPYLSLISFYMWKVAATPDSNGDTNNAKRNKKNHNGSNIDTITTNNSKKIDHETTIKQEEKDDMDFIADTTTVVENRKGSKKLNETMVTKAVTP